MGPKCWDEQTLEKLLDAGLDVMRLNFSHGSHEGHLEVLQRFRKVLTPSRTAPNRFACNATCHTKQVMLVCAAAVKVYSRLPVKCNTKQLYELTLTFAGEPHVSAIQHIGRSAYPFLWYPAGGSGSGCSLTWLLFLIDSSQPNRVSPSYLTD